MSSPNEMVITNGRDQMSVSKDKTNNFIPKNKIWDSLITEDMNCEKLQNGREMRRDDQQRIQSEKDRSVGYNSK